MNRSDRYRAARSLEAAVTGAQDAQDALTARRGVLALVPLTDEDRASMGALEEAFAAALDVQLEREIAILQARRAEHVVRPLPPSPGATGEALYAALVVLSENDAINTVTLNRHRRGRVLHAFGEETYEALKQATDLAEEWSRSRLHLPGHQALTREPAIREAITRLGGELCE